MISKVCLKIPPPTLDPKSLGVTSVVTAEKIRLTPV
jgi:hypothetical protein